MLRRERANFRAGWIATDVIMAVAIVAILLSLLTVAVTRQRRGSERLADSRDAIRLAEATLTTLQTGTAPPPAPQGFAVQVRPLPQAQEGDLRPPPGTAWVEVEVTFNGRRASLVGLVRADAAKEAMR